MSSREALDIHLAGAVRHMESRTMSVEVPVRVGDSAASGCQAAVMCRLVAAAAGRYVLARGTELEGWSKLSLARRRRQF